MIERVNSKADANKCDKLLTELILDEKKYDKTLDNNFIVKDYFVNQIKNPNNILLVYKDNDVIGYIYLRPINDNIKNYLIDGLYVEENYRNKGIGKKLITEAIKYLKNINAEYIDINVMYDNDIARKLYKYFEFNEFKLTMRKYM